MGAFAMIRPVMRIVMLPLLIAFLLPIQAIASFVHLLVYVFDSTYDHKMAKGLFYPIKYFWPFSLMKVWS